ncbi:MAG: DUF423 domain-containing protein [Sphingomonadaceae bacterium]|nr:DUF423 domain-containing protein [Sphingomonadaceae bacterium]
MIQTVAALAAAVAIAAGAFGAHAAQGIVADWLKTGSFYLLVHAIAILALGRMPTHIGWLLLGGAGLFAATLYSMALGAPRWFGAITPIGGAAMIIGWLLVALQFARR